MRKKIALYNPYLDTLGGGEKHILSILKVLEDLGFEINIFWDSDLSSQIKERLNISFKNKLSFLPNIFCKGNSFFGKLKVLKQFEIFFYITDGSYFFSSAKRNFIFCMVPKRDLYEMSFLNKLKAHNFRFISNSNFTKSILLRNGVNSNVIYPYLENEYINMNINSLKKNRVILSVGRFFKYLHAKRQDVIINLFNKFVQEVELFKDFKLILAGGLKEEDKDYFGYLEKIAAGKKSIILKPNLSYRELLELYKQSLIYWHFTGYGIDESKNPELVEHLGIAPLEAMATGCLTFCYKAGGPKELIIDGKNGFLFDNKEELLAKTTNVLKNLSLQNMIKTNAKEFVRKNFNHEVFKKRVLEVILD